MPSEAVAKQAAFHKYHPPARARLIHTAHTTIANPRQGQTPQFRLIPIVHTHGVQGTQVVEYLKRRNACVLQLSTVPSPPQVPKVRALQSADTPPHHAQRRRCDTTVADAADVPRHPDQRCGGAEDLQSHVTLSLNIAPAFYSTYTTSTLRTTSPRPTQPIIITSNVADTPRHHTRYTGVGGSFDYACSTSIAHVNGTGSGPQGARQDATAHFAHRRGFRREQPARAQRRCINNDQRVLALTQALMIPWRRRRMKSARTWTRLALERSSMFGSMCTPPFPVNFSSLRARTLLPLPPPHSQTYPVLPRS